MIKLAQPYIPQKAIDDVVAVLESGNLVQGKYVTALEEALQQYLGIEHAIVVSSGTAALHLALIASGITSGDEVIVPAFTFPATANVVELIGAKPVLVDITLDDFCIDISQIEAAITENTKAIMPVHEFGQAANMEHIMAIARQHHLHVIEDAACALGTEYRQQKVGTFGMLGCFSFHPRKAITTGEGGVIVTHDENLASKIRVLRNHGIEYGAGRIDFTYAGLNYRMTDFQAALGFGQFADLDSMIEERIELAVEYDRMLADLSQIKTPTTFAERKMVYQTYHILLDTAIDRSALITNLKARGIETNYGAQALHCLTYYQKKYGHIREDFPRAAMAYFQGLALPMGHHLNKDAVRSIVATLGQQI